ncbi:hypothetical protein niasHT_022068 [Heterodera trifolii]|uniref:Uncharacterized protein n=1 Tax=Heterodera trifolii TaxID=157864 RepID=A0ABD2JJD5_9BILA
MGFSKTIAFLSLLALFCATIAEENAGTVNEGTEAEATTVPTLTAAAEGGEGGEEEVTTAKPTETSETAREEGEEKHKANEGKAIEGSGTRSLWQKVTCMLFGFFPFRAGCPGKTDIKAGSSSHVSSRILIIEEKEDSESDEQMDGAGGDEEKRGGENDSEAQGGKGAAEDNEMEDEELKVKAVVEETTANANEQGKTETNVEQSEKEGPMN